MGLVSPNGFINGNAVASKGLVNGTVPDRRGFVNGTPPDAGRGLANGVGRVNGMRADGGLTNGLPRPRLPTNLAGVVAQKDLRMGVSLLLLSILLLGPLYYYLASLETGVEAAIVIDGDFEDWMAVPRYVEATRSSNAHVNLREYGVVLEDNTLFLYARVEGIMLGDYAGYDSLFAFIDRDGDSSTGYSALGLGADYLLEVSGGNASVAAANLMEFTGADRLDWSGWTGASGARAAVSLSSIEVAVPVVGLDIGTDAALRILMQDNEGSASRTSIAVGPEYGALSIRRGAVTHVVGGAPDAPLMRLTMKAMGGDVTVQQLTFSVSDNLAGAAGPGMPHTIPAGSSWVVNVSVDSSSVGSGELVTVDLASVEADRPVTLTGEAARAYVDSIPAGKTVDGIFSDWTDAVPDPSGDVVRAELDLVAGGADMDGQRAFFYARTLNTILAGVPAPVVRTRPAPSGPGGPQPPPVPVEERRSGEDFLRLYVDTNTSDAVGQQVGGMRPDRLISVRGYEGRILSKELLEWRDGWVPLQAVVEAGKGADEIELSVPLADLGAMDQAAVLIEMTDWAGRSDRVDSVPGLRGHHEGTRSGISYDPLFSGDGANAFVVTGTQDFALNGSAVSISMRFTAKNTFSVTEVRVYFSVVSSPPSYNASIQGDSAGSPDGSALCTGSATPAAVGWTTFSCSASITATTVYHLVVNYSSGTIGPSNYSSARYTTPNNNLYPKDGSSDSATDVLTNDGGGWISENAQPVYVVDSASTYEGNPYHNFSVKEVFGTTGWGDKFSVTSDRSFNQAKFYVNKTGTPPDLVMKLRRVSSPASELRSVTVGVGSVGTAFGWVTFTFSPVTLLSTEAYAIYLQTSGGGGDANNKYSTPASVSVGGSPYENLTYDGVTTNQTEVDTTGPTFTDALANDIPFQLIPEFEDLLLPAVVAAVFPVLLRRRGRQNGR